MATMSEEGMLAQWAAFQAALPGLMRDHPNQWCVWFGKLQYVSDSDDDAERWALKHLPRDADFVLARAAKAEPSPLSGLADLNVR